MTYAHELAAWRSWRKHYPHHPPFRWRCEHPYIEVRHMNKGTCTRCDADLGLSSEPRYGRTRVTDMVTGVTHIKLYGEIVELKKYLAPKEVDPKRMEGWDELEMQ